VQIGFDTPEPCTPYDFRSADRRLLGLALTRLSFARAQADG
jgi:hypothetical protein